MLPGRQCGLNCTWAGACFVSSDSVVLEPTDPSVTHGCGLADYSVWSDEGCSAASSLLADWTGQLPGGVSAITLDFSTLSNGFPATIEYYVNGTLAATRGDFSFGPCSPGECRYQDYFAPSFADCSTVEIKVIDSSGGQVTLDEIDFIP